ncbi:MAG TPA: hypothetical protein DEQ47_08480 [Solibacterales bacterium]|nr:hypothetical protein [Bryobacterales bacterium]
MEPPDAPLQFDTAEYAGGSGPVCSGCQRPAISDYYRANGRVFCRACRGVIEQQLGNPGQMGRAALYGAGAAAAGAVLYYAVLAITHLQIGLIAVAVGYLVGRAVRQGSGAPGGRKYQALAVALTYVAIASSYLPGLYAARAQAGAQVSDLTLAGLALGEPLTGGLRHPLSLVITGIGLWQAWKFNQPAKVEFSGPYAGVSAA